MEFYHIKTENEEYFIDNSGIKQNTYISYHNNKNIHIKTNYKDGKREGRFLVFYDNGNLGIDTECKNDKLNGYHKHFDCNGNLISHCNYIDGKKI